MLCGSTLSGKTAQVLHAPALPASTGFRIALGSCTHQGKAQPALEAAAARSLDRFVWLGGNLYEDTDNTAVLKRKSAPLGHSCNGWESRTKHPFEQEEEVGMLRQAAASTP